MENFRERMMARTEDDLQKLDRWMRALMRESRPQELSAAGDNTPLSETADAARVSADERARAELQERLLERSARLQQALHKMRRGTYGLCISCEKPIHPERLEAIPDAAIAGRLRGLTEIAGRTPAPDAEDPG